MAEEKNKSDKKAASQSGDSTDNQNQTGDPGRTPGMAEGDEETVDESLREKQGKDKN